MNFMQKTVNGLAAMECVSAIQKCIRRGDERRAMLFCLELAHSSRAYFTMTLNRLRVCAHEDIGLADPQAVQFVMATCDMLADFYEKSGWRIMLGNCVRILCRAKKLREGDHFVWVTLSAWEQSGPGEIPDVALDQHTARGKAMGRGKEHFLTEGTVLVPEPTKDADLYKDEAYVLMRAGKGPKSGPKAGKPFSKPQSKDDDKNEGAGEDEFTGIVDENGGMLF